MTALDLGRLDPESFGCLVLEIWTSEVYDRLGKKPFDFETKNDRNEMAKKKLIGMLTTKAWPDAFAISEKPDEADQSLVHAFRYYPFELFKTWLLLVDVLDLDRMIAAEPSFGLAVQDGLGRGAAVRHWYSSACMAQGSDEEARNVLVVGLPGHFSVRGDHFLAVARDSRSSRLADHALDILSSRRGNIARLHTGMGLPVRDIDLDDGFLRSRLLARTKEGPEGTRSRVSYSALKQLGATDTPGSFFWFWRSGLSDYGAHCRSWRTWLARMGSSWSQLKSSRGIEWVPGFEIYDRIERHNIQRPAASWVSEDWMPGSELTNRKGQPFEAARCSQQKKSMNEWQAADTRSYDQFMETWRDFQIAAASISKLMEGSSNR